MKFNIVKDVCGLFSEFSQCTQKGLVEDILLVVGEEIHLYRYLEHLLLESVVDFPAAAETLAVLLGGTYDGRGPSAGSLTDTLYVQAGEIVMV